MVPRSIIQIAADAILTAIVGLAKTRWRWETKLNAVDRGRLNNEKQ